MAIDLPKASFDQYFVPMLQKTDTDTAKWNCDEDEYCYVYNADITTGCEHYNGNLEPIILQFGDT